MTARSHTRTMQNQKRKLAKKRRGPNNARNERLDARARRSTAMSLWDVENRERRDMERIVKRDARFAMLREREAREAAEALVVTDG